MSTRMSTRSGNGTDIRPEIIPRSNWIEHLAIAVPYEARLFTALEYSSFLVRHRFLQCCL